MSGPALGPIAAFAGLVFLVTSLAVRFSGLTPNLPWGVVGADMYGRRTVGGLHKLAAAV